MKHAINGISPSMTSLLSNDRIKCVSPDCPSRWYCLHYTREAEDGLTWIMPINTGVDCYDFEPCEDD